MKYLKTETVNNLWENWQNNHKEINTIMAVF